MIFSGIDAILANLLLQGIYIVELDLIPDLFQELHPDGLSIQFFIKIEDVGLHVFSIMANGGFDPCIGNAGISDSIVNTVGDIDSVGRAYHSFIHVNVGGGESNGPADPVAHLDFSADGIIAAQILGAFVHLTFCNQLPNQGAAHQVPIHLIRGQNVKAETAPLSLLDQELGISLSLVAESEIKATISFLHF